MSPDLIKRAAAHYPYHPKYQRAWLRMITLLGDKWLLAGHTFSLYTYPDWDNYRQDWSIDLDDRVVPKVEN